MRTFQKYVGRKSYPITAVHVVRNAEVALAHHGKILSVFSFQIVRCENFGFLHQLFRIRNHMFLPDLFQSGFTIDQ